MAGLLGMFNDPAQMEQLGLALGLLNGKKGENPGLLIQQFANQQMKRKQMEEQQKLQALQLQQAQQGIERGGMEMEQFRRQQDIQERLRQSAGSAFGPAVQPHGPTEDGGNMPNIGGGGMQQFAQSAMQIDPLGLGLQLMPKPQTPKYHNVGGALVQEPTEPGGQARPVYQAPQDQWKELGRDPLTRQIIMENSKTGERKAVGSMPTQVTTNVMPPREIFKDSLALKKDFDGLPEVKGFKEVQGAWDQISTALQNPSPANDLAAATKFMKLLDPGSVVRESELMMAMQASGALDRMANYHNRLLKGEKLTPQQRQDFFSAGQALYQAAGDRFGQTVKQYEDIAGQYGLDKQFIPKKQERPQSLKPNMTAIVKARDAIKRGADPEAVKQRLIEQGYDPKGL